MNSTITQQQLLTDWLRISIERFQHAMDDTGVIGGGSKERKALRESFITQVIVGSGGDVQKALIQFAFHGRYVDMGVGRGFAVGSQKARLDFLKYRNEKGQLHKIKRKPKKWYAITLAGQTKKLSELMAEHFGIQAITAIEGPLNPKGGIEIRL